MLKLTALHIILKIKEKVWKFKLNYISVHV